MRDRVLRNLAAGPSEASEAAEVPNDYVCSITAEIMTDHGTTVEGRQVHLRARGHHGVAPRTNNTSPFTGTTLESKALIPNLSLRSLIRNSRSPPWLSPFDP